jgi:hypothetical protein
MQAQAKAQGEMEMQSQTQTRKKTGTYHVNHPGNALLQRDLRFFQTKRHGTGVAHLGLDPAVDTKARKRQ